MLFSCTSNLFPCRSFPFVLFFFSFFSPLCCLPREPASSHSRPLFSLNLIFQSPSAFLFSCSGLFYFIFLSHLFLSCFLFYYWVHFLLFITSFSDSERRCSSAGEGGRGSPPLYPISRSHWSVGEVRLLRNTKARKKSRRRGVCSLCSSSIMSALLRLVGF